MKNLIYEEQAALLSDMSEAGRRYYLSLGEKDAEVLWLLSRSVAEFINYINDMGVYHESK